MNQKGIQILVNDWLDEEKRPLMAKGHKQLFEFLARADEGLIKDFQKIAKAYRRTKSNKKYWKGKQDDKNKI